MSTENKHRYCDEYRYTLGSCFSLEIEPKGSWCVKAIDFNKREYWLESMTLEVGLNPLEPKLGYQKKIRREISWVDDNSSYFNTYELDGVEKNGILKHLEPAWAVITPLPSDEWQTEFAEYKTKGVTQMPSEAIIKFAFSFRANGIRITLTAEPENENCLVTITNSNGKDKQGRTSLEFIKKIEELVGQHRLYEWSGFRESSSNHQFICESFFLEIELEGNPQKSDNEGFFFNLRHMEELENSTNIYAEGSSSFPRGFFEAKRKIFKLFDSVKVKHVQDVDTINQRKEKPKRRWGFLKRGKKDE